jgi:hypothetical protein
VAELVAANLALHPDQGSSFQDIRRKNKILKAVEFGHKRIGKATDKISRIRSTANMNL